MSLERRKPRELPIDPEITTELIAADVEARRELADRGGEFLDRLRQL